MDYIPIKIIRNEKSYFFLWCGNDDVQDDQIFALQRQIRYFDSLNELRQFTESISVEVNHNAVAHEIDLDAVQRWIEEKQACSPDTLLTAWNLFSDFRLENDKWQRFQVTSNEAAPTHFVLSQSVMAARLNPNTNQRPLSSEVLASISKILLEGLVAFDATVEKRHV